MPSMSQHDNI
jgi:hypothetical protein